ncbi:MAG: hypothetical protein K6F14_03340 [Clostridiales bacterium]|nr:hypothetical protein [Clostridiales bacterium]
MAYRDLMNLISDVRNELKSDYTFEIEVVGSYARDMITYDENSNVGYDFDVNVCPYYDEDDYTPKQIKLLFKDALDKHSWKYNYDYAEDSTSVLTIKVKDRINSRIIHSVDFCFVSKYQENGEIRYQYIHRNKVHETYVWQLRSKGYHDLPKKIEWINRNNLGDEVFDLYIKKKNKNNNPHYHSRTIFAITVNEVCQKNGYFD